MAENAPAPSATEAPVQLDPRYVIERELGRGAMGRVFLARDLRLDRLVAIKALAPGNREPQDLRRLEQEARTAGSLHHPNIVAVHDIGASGGGPFIVTEFLRGQTLRQLLDGTPGKLSHAQVMGFLSQLAAGLAVAHEHGIVHRDLKPENLFVTGEGTLKILDFGIARRSPPALPGDLPAAPAQLTQAEQTALSLLQPLTNPGAILGTVGYMSPEQLRGKPADARSDLFSVGVILYELLSGVRAFAGETPLATSRAILDEEPRPLPADAPPALRELALRCLRKDPAERPQSARELADQLDAQRSRGPGSRPRRTDRRLWAALALLAALVGGGIAIALHRAQRGPPSFRQLTFQPGGIWSSRFAPDGRVLYSAAPDASPPHLFATSAGAPGPEGTPLDLPAAQLLAVSPRGELAVLLGAQFIYTSVGRGDLVVVRDGKLDPRVLARDVDAADFASDGSLAVARRESGQGRIEFPPGKVIFSSAGSVIALRFSPAGDKLAYALRSNLTEDSASVLVLDLASGTSKTLIESVNSIYGLAWSPSAGEVWFSGRPHGSGAEVALHAVSLSGKERVLTESGGELHLYDVSRAGQVLAIGMDRRLLLATADRAGAPGLDLSLFDRSFLNDASADGKVALVTVGGQAAGKDDVTLYLRPVDGGPPQRLGTGSTGALSPDGTTVLGFDDASATLFLPGGQSRAFDTHGLTLTLARFEPGGKSVLAFARRPKERSRLFRLPLDGGAPVALTEEGEAAMKMAVSVDGQFVAFSDGVALARVLALATNVVRDLPGALRGETVVGWTRAGQVLLSPLRSVRVPVFAVDPASGARSEFATLVPRDSSAMAISRVVIPPDGSPILFNYYTLSTHLFEVDGLR